MSDDISVLRSLISETQNKISAIKSGAAQKALGGTITRDGRDMMIARYERHIVALNAAIKSLEAEGRHFRQIGATE